jgi:ferredoxin-NADP reductase
MNNVALVEIKTPKTELILSRTYRDQVYMVAPEITNAVVQVLDQRQRLMLHFLSVMHRTNDASGHIEVALLERLDVPRQSDFYLCGPSSFLQNMRDGLAKWGVPSNRPHFEI